MKVLIIFFCFVIVAEQAESIDNPMHEAAKRGVHRWTDLLLGI